FLKARADGPVVNWMIGCVLNPSCFTPCTLNSWSRITRYLGPNGNMVIRLHEFKGRWPGRELDDWLRAESELLHPMHLELMESDNHVTVRAEVPGFSAKELEINVEPRRLTISGKRETKDEAKKGNTVYSELCAGEILRVVDRPTDVGISNAAATLKDGILNIKMTKTPTPKSVRVELKTAG